jgi:anti-sigma regulatory factor (Ser/Thr protein kinase)
VVALPAGPASVSKARRLLRVFAAGTLAGSYDLDLLVSEVVTNALEHAGLREGDPLRIEARLSDVSIRVCVYDDGPGIPERVWMRAPDAAWGHGLAIVDRLASAWGCQPGMVWFEL